MLIYSSKKMAHLFRQMHIWYGRSASHEIVSDEGTQTDGSEDGGGTTLGYGVELTIKVNGQQHDGHL